MKTVINVTEEQQRQEVRGDERGGRRKSTGQRSHKSLHFTDQLALVCVYV